MALALTLSGQRAAAHDVPREVVLTSFVKPEGEHLDVLVRVPLVLLLNLHLPKRGPGYLDLARIDDDLERAARAVAAQIALSEDDRELALVAATQRISLPSDPSFASYERARAQIAGGPMPATADVFWNQGYFDAHLRYRIRSFESSFALELGPALRQHPGLKMVVRYLGPGAMRRYEWSGQGDRLLLDPRWHHVLSRFVTAGFRHLVGSWDPFLFLVCLIIPLRRPLASRAAVIASFAAAHSAALFAATYGLWPQRPWLPPVATTLMAVSIFYLAVENIAAKRPRARWASSGAFGLVHGVGFSFALRPDLALAGGHRLWALISFNVGIELGLLVVLALAIPLSLRFAGERNAVVLVLSLLMAHASWHWMLQRKEHIPWGAIGLGDPAAILPSAPWLLAIVLAAAALGWGKRKLTWRRGNQRPVDKATPSQP